MFPIVASDNVKYVADVRGKVYKPAKRHNEDDSNAYYIFTRRNSNVPV
jgi:hypothetical protein